MTGICAHVGFTPTGPGDDPCGTTGTRRKDRKEDPMEHRLNTPLSLALACTAAALAAAFPAGAEPDDDDEQAFGAVSVIIETNATDCDSGLQFFFDADPWRHVVVSSPRGRPVLVVRPRGALAGYGLTEQFNETNEPVMAELADAAPELECDEAEGTLEDLFHRFPAGAYEFEGLTVEGEELDGEAVLSHVIPAPPVLLSPEEDVPADPDGTVVRWERVDGLIPVFPNVFGPRGITDGDVEIVAFEIVVDREAVDGVEAPLRILDAKVPGDVTEVMLPPGIMEPNSLYKLEVLQIDRSGNQTIAESTFETQ